MEEWGQGGRRSPAQSWTLHACHVQVDSGSGRGQVSARSGWVSHAGKTVLQLEPEKEAEVLHCGSFPEWGLCWGTSWLEACLPHASPLPLVSGTGLLTGWLMSSCAWCFWCDLRYINRWHRWLLYMSIQDIAILFWHLYSKHNNSSQSCYFITWNHPKLGTAWKLPLTQE